jgi:acetylornithine deacetylase/succinyl-diaminopimelate desuccinylase-like protein
VVARVTRVLALIPDLLFGSNVAGLLRAAGIDIELVGDTSAVAEHLPRASVLIVDLTGDLDGAALVESFAASGALGETKTLGFYSHIDVQTRERAQRAGFDLVVPRSRMAREGAELVRRILDDG